MIKRGLAVALSASLLAGTMTVSASLPTAAASGSRVETDAKGGVTITLDGREVWQAASAAMQKADAVTGDIADRIMAQTGSNGNPVVLEDDIYEMELPENALRGLPAGLGMDMYISAGAEDAAEDYTAAEEEEAAAVTAEVSSASDLAHTATGVAERPVRDFFASNMFSLVRENDDSAPAGTAAAAGGEGYELNGSEHIYFVLSNATDQDVNYTIKMGGMELLKTKVLKSHGNTEGVIGATVSSLIGIPDSASGMTRATGSDMATASGLMGETELTDDVVAKVVRTTLKNFFVIYRSDETDLGTKVMVVTTADTKFKAEGGGLLSGRTEKPVLHVEDVLKGTKKYEDAEKALRDNDVDHADFAAMDISFRKTAGGTEDYEPYEGQIVNVRIETRAVANFNPDSVSIQHHLEDGTLETVAGTTRKTKQTFIEINDDAADGAVSGTTTLTEDNQTEVTVESDNDGNVYTFDEDANRALMQKQLNRAKSKSSFRMSVGSGETRLENDTESETGAPKKTTSEKTAVKTANNTSTATTVSSDVDANGVKTEVREEKGKGGLKVEDGKIVADFVVDSFSIYTIVDTGDDGDHARMTLHFMNGAEEVASMIVKNSDTRNELDSILYDPGAGTIPANSIFKGWWLADPVSDTDHSAGTEYTVSDAENGWTIAQVRDWAEGYSIEEGEDKYLYAMLYKNYVIDYLDEKNVGIGSANVFMVSTDTTVPYTVNMGYTPADDMHGFIGWNVAKGGSNISDHTAGKLYENGTPITISGDVTFSVNAPEGHWLVFDENGKGGTYNAPRFIKAGEATSDAGLLSMTRKGYTFGGWYTDADCTDGNEFSFGGELSEATTIYAKWIPEPTAKYTVIIWKENLAADGYDFEEAITLEGNVNTVISTVVSHGTGSSSYASVNGVNKQYLGFHLKEFTQNVNITPEGTATVEVYYDRNDITYRLYNTTSSSSSSFNNNNLLYTLTGKYGQSLEDCGYTWPDAGNGMVWAYRRNNSTIIQSSLYAFSLDGGATALNFYKYSITYYGRNEYLFEQADGTWTVGIQSGSTGTSYIGYESYAGYYPKEYRTNVDQAGVWHTLDAVDSNGHAYDSNNYEPNNTGAANPHFRDGSSGILFSFANSTYKNRTVYVRYARKSYTINFTDGKYVDGNGVAVAGYSSTGQLSESEEITYGADISGCNYTPEAPEGFVFGGWYIDSECTQAFDFSTATMPEGGLTLFAKWIQVEYRVFLHPNADHISDLSWGSDSQQMNFRVGYDGHVSTPTGRSSEYEFVGWYTSSACTAQSLFTSSIKLNEMTVTADYDKTTDFTDVMDKWGNGATTNSDITGNNGGDRFWITKKLDLYAKWRAKLVGALGIGVIYDGGEGTNAPSDDNKYLDTAEATAGVASTAPEGKQFVRWVIQTWDSGTNSYIDKTDGSGNAVGVYPGEKFEVLKSNARYVIVGYADPENPENISVERDDTHTELVATYTVQLRAEYVDIGSGTPSHIFFYANNQDTNGDLIPGVKITGDDANEPKDETTYAKVTINQAYDILSIESVLAGNQLYKGYTFLGWAKERDATVPWAALNEDGTYTVVQDGKIYDKATQIAADEKNPIENLYALWERSPILTVQKQVTGNMGNRFKAFKFTLTLDQAADIEVEGVAQPSGKTDKKVWEFSLPHNKEIAIPLPKGTKFTLVEEQVNYIKTFKVGDTEITEGAEQTINSDMTISVTNHRDVTVPTGVNTDLHFWKWLVGACFLALIGAAMYGRKKRRM